MNQIQRRIFLRSALATVVLMLGTGSAPAETTEPAIATALAAEPGLEWRAPRTEGRATARHENGFVALNGRLYLLGGRGRRPLDIFDPATGRWTQGAQPPVEIHHVQAVAHEGKLYVLGALTGSFPEETPQPNVLIYDPSVNRWTRGPVVPPNRRRGASGVVAHGGLIYVVGGNTRGHMSGYVSWLDSFNPATGRWQTLPDAPRSRDHFHSVVIDGKLYAAGGRRTSYESNQTLALVIPEVDVYDIATGQWRTLDTPLPTPRGGTASVSLGGQLLVMGGESVRQQKAHREVEAYDPVTGRWETLPPLPVGRHGTQASLHNGLVYIAAGSADQGGGPELNDIFVLGPRTAN